jgi:hypothetical protein
MLTVDPKQAYREWAIGTIDPYSAEDAFCAGFALGAHLQEEAEKTQNNKVVKNLKDIADKLDRGFM